jgi:hypothetical protein
VFASFFPRGVFLLDALQEGGRDTWQACGPSSKAQGIEVVDFEAIA